MTSYKNAKDPNDSGIKVGRSFKYKAIAEEDGQLADGSAEVLGTEKINGYDTFRVRVKFKNIQSISFMTASAEVVQINQPISGHQVKVSTQEEATRGFPSSEKSLKTLFGTIPKASALATAIVDTTQALTVQPPNDLPAKKKDINLGLEPDLKVNEGSKILVPPGKGMKQDTTNE
jgi:hypothetical protein